MYLLADIVCGRLDRHGITYIDDQELLSGRRDDRGIMVAAPIHQAFNVWLTKLLWKGEVPTRYHAFIATAVKDDPVTFHRLATRAFGESLANRMMDLALTNRIADSSELAEPCKRALWREAFRRSPWTAFRDSANDVRYAVQRLIAPAGFEVALLGPDGVGKSSIAAFLSTRPRREAAFKTVLHQQTYQPVLPRLSTIARKLTKRPLPSRADPFDPHGSPALHPLVWLLRYGYYTLDQWLAYTGTRRAMASGHLVIKDRHWMELGVDSRRYRYVGPPIIPCLLSRLVPWPSVVIVLDAPTEVIHARKQELSTGDIETLRSAYQHLLTRVRNGHLVNADRPPGEVAADVLRIVNEHARARTIRQFPHAQA
jgi:thymidylate kinase